MPHTFDITALLAHRRRARGGDRGRLPAATQPSRSALDHRRVPALGRHRPHVEPGRHLAPGARVRHRAGAHRPLPRAVPRRRRVARPHVAVGATRQRRVAGRHAAHARRRCRRGRRRTPAGGRPQRGQLDARHRRSAAVVAACARRPAADDDRRDGHRRRRVERSALAPDRAALRRLERLDLLGQRRAAVHQGRQPAADPHRARRGQRRRRPPRHRAGGRGRARRAARARPHRHAGDVRRRRRARRAAAPGLPAAVGVRPLGARRRRSPRRGPRSTCSATTRRSCSGTRTTNRPRWRSASRATARRPGCATSPPSSCRRGTRRCSTGG